MSDTDDSSGSDRRDAAHWHGHPATAWLIGAEVAVGTFAVAVVLERVTGLAGWAVTVGVLALGWLAPVLALILRAPADAPPPPSKE